MTPENSQVQTTAEQRLELIKLGHERHPGADHDALVFAILAIAVAEGKNIEDFLAGEDCQANVTLVATSSDDPVANLDTEAAADSRAAPGAFGGACALPPAVVRQLPPLPRVWATMTRMWAEAPRAMRREDVQDKTGLGFRANREAMIELERRGAIRREGSGRWTRYRLVKPYEAGR
ncbi:MAG: hypothetical protein ACK4NA_12725 [Alphaproteobacteria bacterium]